MKHRSRVDNYPHLLSGVRISARYIDHLGSWHADSVTMGSSPGKNWENAAHVHIWQRLNSDAKRVSRKNYKIPSISLLWLVSLQHWNSSR